MSNEDPGYVEIEPAAPARASVVWLHGLGADGHDFEPVVPQLQLPPRSGVRFVFPHAQVQPVTLNGGMPMRAWFDIAQLGFEGDWDAAGVERSVTRLQDFVEREIRRGIARSRIVIAGFSQGGAVAIEYLLRHGSGLAGVMALSTFHPAAVTGTARAPADAPPVFAAHGEKDSVVAYSLGERTAAALAHAGYSVDWHRYPMAHQVSPPEIADLGYWLRARLSSA